VIEDRLKDSFNEFPDPHSDTKNLALQRFYNNEFISHLDAYVIESGERIYIMKEGNPTQLFDISSSSKETCAHVE